MKKLILAMCLALALSVSVKGEPNDVTAVTFRILSVPDTTNTDVEGWIGFRKGDSEAGFIVGYLDEKTDEDASVTVGGFSMFHFPDVRPAIENTFWLAEFLPESIVAEPSVGIALTYNLSTESLKVSPFVALRLYKTLELHIGYEDYGDDANIKDGMKVGLSTMWNF